MKNRLWLAMSLVLGAGLMIALLTVAALAQENAPAAWVGSWQPGPDMDATIWGGPAGEGLARFSGHYYSGTKKIYFLGGRRENNSTTGVIFTFDPNSLAYANTGQTMPLPISNYYISQVDDDGRGHGPGLYVVAGRLSNGSMTQAVQVYYPDDNTAEQLTGASFPGAARLVGGQAVVEDQIYVFGGFDGTTMFADTWVYSPTAQTWTNLNCPLPTARSYIATAVAGHKIYAIGGDEFTGAALVPLTDTVVLDIDNLAACWQDDLMADLPQANGDAPAVYVDEGYLGGGIYVIGGYWPQPGPYRWVFRYDLATDTWEDFPQLTVPSPSTGRRNQAAVYVPASAQTSPTGLGDGIPGLWTFGGYDGSNANAMTESSEFFSIEANPVLVLPEQVEQVGVGGSSVVHQFYLVNQAGFTDTFDLSYTADVTWSVSLPISVGPVADGEQVSFTMRVSLPANVPCPTTGYFTVTAVAHSSPVVSDSQRVSVRAACGVGGIVRDATTGQPLANAYVWIQNTPDGLDAYYDTFTDANGHYVIADVPPDIYYLGISARYFQPSFYPSGWPTGAITMTISGDSVVVDRDLVGSQMDWSPAALSVTLPADTALTKTLTLTNSGTGPLFYAISEVGSRVPTPPPARRDASGIPRVDPQLYADLEAEGRTDFLVVLKGEADLSKASTIADWEARGRYVLDTLRSFARQRQRNLRAFLSSQQVSYEPLYIINGVIVKGGDRNLVDRLAARPDVAYLQANRRIPLTDPIGPVYDSPNSPNTVEWNIQRVNADDVWNMGYTGQGIVVAEIDTGTEYDHPALYRQYRGYRDGGTYDHNYNWYDPYAQCPNGGSTPCDPGAHGTHVMGTMVGEDASRTNQIGVAPGAKWISCKGGDAVSGYLLTNELLQCAEWILAPWDLNGQNADPAMRPHVVNNSWGGGPNDYWYTGAVAAWRAAGIFPVFANGNAGPSCSTAHSPGDYWNTFAVGATDSTNAIAGFSSRGPAEYTGILKPDISAPGANIRSSVPGGGYQGGWNGTSMAAPHTAGAVALLWSADPELIGQVDLSGWLLQQSALPLYTTEGCGGDTPSSHPNNAFGYGLLDAEAAVNAALSGVDTLPWLTVQANGSISPGGDEAVGVTFDAPQNVGTYTGTLWLVADDPYNHDVRIPVTLTVLPTPPTASFDSSSPDLLGETTVFTNTSTGSAPMVYLWNFGDGVTSMLDSPTHTYTALGTYTVVMTATNSEGSSTFSSTVIISDVPPVADFTVNTLSGSVGDVFTFTNASSGTNLSYLWNFGDGMTSTLESPTHTYTVGGLYTVTLQASNSAGSDTARKSLDVAGPPQASFLSSSPDLLGQTTHFTDTSTAHPPVTAWLWVFETGQISTDPSPSYDFAAAGIYSVSLTVANTAGNDRYEDEVIICSAWVSGTRFVATPASPSVSQTVSFQGSVAAGDEFTERPVEYSWDFGDGGLAAGNPVTHTFTMTGTYTIVLTATGPCGTDVYTDTLGVGAEHRVYLPLILRNK